MRRKYFLLLIINILLFLLLSYKIDFFTQINKSIYNQVFSFLPQPNKLSDTISLVDVSSVSAQELEDVFTRISSYQPDIIFADIFHQNLDINNTRLQTLLELHNKTVFTLAVRDLEKQKEAYTGVLKTNKDFFLKNSSHLGLYRLNDLYQNIPYENCKAELSLGKILSDQDSSCAGFINYNANPAFIKISAIDILQENIIPEFFKDKKIILSNFNNIYAVTDFDTGLDGFFLHQNHMAFFISSIYTDDWLIEFTPVQYFVFFTFYIALWIFLVYLLKNRYTLLLLTFSFVLPLVVYLGSVSYLYFLFPVSEMILISLSVDFLLFKHWQDLKSKDESSLLINIASRLQDKIVHTTFFNSDEAWKDLSSLINQLFNLNKNILFEKLEGDTRIKEIVSHNCSFTDIQEMRRDYTREPYTSAIEHKKMIAPSRSFFQGLDEKKEKEFIVPLIFREKLVGFWAFSLDLDEIEEVSDFEKLINSCAQEVSELVFQRNVFISQKNTSSKSFDKMLNVEITDEHTNKLKRSLAIIEKRMLLTETLFDNIHSKVIIYNLFGKIVQLNVGMDKLLQEEDIASYTLSAGEMLSTLTDLNITQSKELIRDVIFTQRKHIQFVYLKSNKKRHLLTISSISKNEIAHKFSENYIFDTFGVLFELVDLSFIEKNYQLKQQLIEQSQSFSKERLESFENAIRLHFNNEDRLDGYEYTGSELEAMIHNIVYMQNKLHVLIEQSVNTNNEIYPIDIVKSIRDVLEVLEKRNSEKKIRFELSTLFESSFVLACVNTIDMHLYTLLLFLINDSEESGRIQIDIQARAELIEVSFKSHGYGIPQEQFQAYLTSESAPSSYRKIIEVRDDIQSWYGDLECSSKLAAGINIKLSLLKVDL